jgi:ABC-type multidrug transport system fused ATPase/permease subunit
MIRFLFRSLKGYRFLIVIAIAMTFAGVGADILIAFPLKFILDKILNNKDPSFPFLSGLLNLFDHFGSLHKGEVHTQLGVIIFSATMLVVLGLLSAVLSYIQLFLASFIGQNLTARLRKQLFGHLERLSLDWHGKQKKGDLVQRITGNISDIEKLVTDGLVDFIAGILTIVGVIVVMIRTDWQFTVLSTVIVPALFVVVLGYTTGIKAASKKAAKAAGQVANVATEDIGAITVLKAFTLEEREDIRFKRYVGKNREAGLRAGGLQAQFTPIVAILLAIGTAIIIGVGAYVAGGNNFSFWFINIPQKELTIGTLTLFLAYLAKVYQPFRDLSKLTNIATSAASGAERIQEVLDQAPEVLDTKAPYTGPRRFRGDITYENVYFGYTKDTQPVLQGINLQIRTGRRIALVGLSGGGKTTLVKLIPRFYEITHGAVKIDGYDNRAIPLAILRQNVSLVLQESVLFEGTIRENIALGRPDANFSEVVEAAKQANIHDTIGLLPDGYNTMVQEQGKNFSGGQRQRLAIARAILRDAPILILDEPTASLDVEAEAEVMHALDKLIVGRTVLMISHRLSTLGNVDEVIVLKGGRIVEQGSFQELKRQGGVFAALLEEQNRYNADKGSEKSMIRSAFTPLPINGYNNQAQVQGPSSPHRQAVPPVPAPVPVTPQKQPQQQPLRLAPTPPQAFPVAQPPINYQNARQQGQIPMGNQPPPAIPPRNARILIEIDGKIIGERLLDKPILTIGRLSGNDVQVPSQRVSRLHAKIRWENGAWLIEDAESVNGLIYQGSRIDRLVLSDGDKVYVCPTAILHYKDK